MIPQITEIKDKFPTYATLSQATVTLNDMGDKTISTQIKIDGGIVPDFSFDWEVEFQGERYIQPLREPQASKGNESICSVIDLVFQHKTIYDLKRYYFAKMAEVQSGTVSVDKYIADLNLNLEGFCDALQQVLDYYLEIGYLDEPITVNLNPEWQYAEEPQYVQIQYTHIWDVVQKIYDLFGVRWSIESREIKIGYPTEEVAHTFEYGFEGGLLKVERQVQSADIRNSLLGRGGSKNLPYLYFKDLDKYGETGENGTWTPDPDAIPELRNIYFTELRGKTFRDYVQGWKTNPNRDLSYGDVVEEYDTERGESSEGWAYKAGHEDNTFNPIEYVEDKESIAKYGLLQGGLENQEDIYPTIQGVEVDGLGRVDEIVGAEQVVVDEITDKTTIDESKYTQEISGTFTQTFSGINSNSRKHCSFKTDSFEITDLTIVPYLVSDPTIEAIWNVKTSEVRCYGTKYEQCSRFSGISKYNLEFSNLSVALFFSDTEEEIIDTSKLQTGIKYYIKLECDVSGFPKGSNNLEYDGNNNTYRGIAFEVADNGVLSINYSWIVKNIPYNGLIIKANENNSQTISINSNASKILEFTTSAFDIPKSGATNVDIPINIVTEAQGLYQYEKTIKAINTKTNEVVSSINIPEGNYYLSVSVNIKNNSTKKEQFKVELLSAYIILPTGSEEFKPTFDIWVKNIWNTTRNEGESEETYTNRVWTPILGDREGNEAKVVFTTGWLAGHSDYEFVIRDVEYAGGSGVELGGVPAEWKIELIKSDAEIEATGKWIPSTTQQANKGDKFFFIGIDMPHEYTLWAEQAVDNYKGDQLLETAHIKPTWVVQTDKVRLNQLQEGESELLLNALKIGNSLRLADTRFTNGVAQTLYLQSVTYTWQEGTNIVPDVEVVLSDKVTTSTNPVAKLQGEVDALTKQVGSISNIQQVVRAIGDKLYLRKDGFDEVSNSATEFNKLVSSRGYRQGAVGGNGWGLRSEQGKGIIEVDKLIVRDEMQVNSLVVNQVSAIGGKEILSAASITCSRVETTEQGFKCYFDQKRGSVANLFVVNDIAYSQVFNANDITVKFYKREVTEVGDNYILLSLDGYGDGVPQVGDVIAQYGNTDTENNANRQYVIIRDVIGGGHERMLSDLNSVSAEGVEYYFAGRLDGGTPRWFVGDAEGDYAEWKDGVLNIKGKLAIGSDVGGATVVEGGLVTAETIALGSDAIKAGITGVGDRDEDIRIWAGESQGDAQNAPFRVLQNGKLISTDAEIKGHINAESGTFGKGAYAFNIGKVSESGSEIPSIENNATSTSRMTITPYYVEYSAKKEIFNEEIGEWEYTEYGTNIRIGAQLGDGFINSTQLEVITKDSLASNNPLSHNSSIKIACEGIPAYNGFGDVGDVYGNHAIMIEKGNICGLRLQSRRFSHTQTLTLTSGTTTATVENANLLSKYDSVVIAMESMTLVLPHDAEDGQIYYIKPYSGTTTVIVHPLYTHKIMSQREEGPTKALSSGAINIFIFDEENNRWHHGYLT